jgi:subtilase family serine protease
LNHRMKLLVAFAATFLFMTASAWAERLPTHHTRPPLQQYFLRKMEAAQILNLNVVLPLRNTTQLDTLLQQIYDPKNASFGQYLTVDQFTEQFGPTESDHTAVIEFLQSNGLKVTTTYPNRLVINVEGTATAVEKAFHVSMGYYRDPDTKKTFYAPSVEPTVNLSVPLWHIAGLDNYSVPHPANLVDSNAVRNATGSGPGGQFIGSDFRAAYYGGTALTGAGQSVGLLEFGAYNPLGITNYFAKVGQRLTVAVNGVSTDGSPTTCTGSCNDTEQALDIEVSISMAPGMNQVLVYVSDTSDIAIFNRMASDNIAKSLSCSWGWSPADATSDDPIFKEFLAQGQTLFVASGDNGAFKNHSRDVYPADDDFVTSVGATDLITAGPGGPWQSESAWADSGGGVSPNHIPIPKYQQAAGVITAANGGSLTYRNVPDVAAEGNEDNYICYDTVCNGGWGGTS